MQEITYQNNYIFGDFNKDQSGILFTCLLNICLFYLNNYNSKTLIQSLQ